MAGDNQGIIYERKVNANLYKDKLVEGRYSGAGSDSNAPDGFIDYQKKHLKLEIKLDTRTDFGQGSLGYDLQHKKWVLAGAQTPAAKAMRDFLEGIGVPAMVNKAWGPKGAPRRYTVPLEKFRREDEVSDYKNFKDVHVPVDYKSIAKYYNVKNTYYIQIGGGGGLYFMGKDIANIGCAEFKVGVMLRIRLKRSGSQPIYNYRFSTALRIKTLTKSNMDLDDPKDRKAMAARAGNR